MFFFLLLDRSLIRVGSAGTDHDIEPQIMILHVLLGKSKCVPSANARVDKLFVLIMASTN